MKLLFDLFPVILFFATYKLASHDGQGGACMAASAGSALPLIQEPILLATVVAIVATFLQVGWLLFRRKRVEPMLWVSLAIIVVFGGATLYFHNATFIQWKPTILYWLFAGALAFSATVLKKNLIRQTMEEQLSLPEAVWRKLNWAWVAFLLGMGVANLAAMQAFSCDGWVSFKLYGLTGLMLLFVVGQGFLLSPYIEEEKS